MAAILPWINEQKGTPLVWHVLLNDGVDPKIYDIGRAGSDDLLISSIHYRLQKGGVAAIGHVILSPYCCAQGSDKELLRSQIC